MTHDAQHAKKDPSHTKIKKNATTQDNKKNKPISAQKQPASLGVCQRYAAQAGYIMSSITDHYKKSKS